MIEQLLTPAEVAEILQIPLKTLYQWRHRSEGPPALKIGRHLRFRPVDVAAFIDDRAPPRTSDGRSASKRLSPSPTR
jgi:excisionase family DNA binding protein